MFYKKYSLKFCHTIDYINIHSEIKNFVFFLSFCFSFKQILLHPFNTATPLCSGTQHLVTNCILPDLILKDISTRIAVWLSNKIPILFPTFNLGFPKFTSQQILLHLRPKINRPGLYLIFRFCFFSSSSGRHPQLLS